MARNIYIMEGETEEKFFRCLRDYLKIDGKPVKHNLFNKKLGPSILGEKYNKIVLVLDTDLIEKHHIEMFLNNLKKLKSLSKFKITVCLQDKNFEDELSYALEFINNKHDLFKRYNSCSESEFKSKLNKSNNLLAKLKEDGLRLNTLYTRAVLFKDLINDRGIVYSQGDKIFLKDKI